MVKLKLKLLLGTCYLGGWVARWVLKLKLMLTQPPTELKLELGLSLAKTVDSVCMS